MLLRPCLVCGTPTSGQRSRCPAHQQTTPQRGYGSEHQAARATLAQTLPTPCGYGCGKIIQPGSTWHAAHRVDGQPQHGWIVACPTCNQRAKHTPRVA